MRVVMSTKVCCSSSNLFSPFSLTISNKPFTNWWVCKQLDYKSVEPLCILPIHLHRSKSWLILTFTTCVSRGENNHRIFIFFITKTFSSVNCFLKMSTYNHYSVESIFLRHNPLLLCPHRCQA